MSARPGPVDRTLGVTAAAGFGAAGVACGIKPSGGLDLALVVGRPGTIAAGSFTTNQVVAAPVVWSRGRLALSADARVVVINSGNANACTGPAGEQAVLASVRRAAAELGCEPEQVLACSTGVIGVPLEAGKLTDGIAKAARDVGPGGGQAAADAIRTTDTVTKQAAVAVDGVTVGGMAKGAAMLAPELAVAAPPHATMIVVLTTDAVAEPRVLRGVLAEACAGSFNRITVDGAQSTNDTVLLLASGASGRRPHADDLGEAVQAVCYDLAGQMLADAEGGTRVFSVQVGGAGTVDRAGAVARRVAGSPLVKAAVFGGDPNWGRILQAAGAAGIPFDPSQVRLEVRGGPGAAGIAAPRAADGEPWPAAASVTWEDPPERVVLVRDGAPTGADAAEAFAATEIEIRLHLGGTGPWAGVRSADLTPEYVRLNAEYTT
ncbi:MAG TPA: bifunctional glutamate N-acetyltransferase/amino-acid acetyltransferase ArgJ [Actinomycetota bacterium]